MRGDDQFRLVRYGQVKSVKGGPFKSESSGQRDWILQEARKHFTQKIELDIPKNVPITLSERKNHVLNSQENALLINKLIKTFASDEIFIIDKTKSDTIIKEIEDVTKKAERNDALLNFS